MKLKLTIIFFTFFHLFSYAQASRTDRPSENNEAVDQSDNSKKENSFTSIFYGQPGKAALYSLIIPSGGQFYNKRYWKVPLVLAAEGFALRHLINSIDTFQDRDDCRISYFEDSSNPNILACTKISGNTSFLIEEGDAFEEWQAARSQKETAWIIMSVAHLMNIVEAFVDRHLINFDTDEDLSFHNMPHPDVVPQSLIKEQFNIMTFRIPLNAK